jgi:CDP-glucose 4,6-dehydratase
VEQRKRTLEKMVENKLFWKNKRVLVTGHTGFKGSWLSLSLQKLGANLVGLSLDPPTNPNLFSVARVSSDMIDLRCDIRENSSVKDIFKEYQPEIIFHMAAQPLVRYSYINPVETYETNFMGTLNILEAIREIGTVKSAVMITTDKCYENKERLEGYKEDEPMGGFDPYSSSKGAAELLISSYRNSYFPLKNFSDHMVGLASARAGNVIGGGDWAEDRLVPDILNSLTSDQKVKVRSPFAIRPWQHVLEPVFGYLRLAENLALNGKEFSEGWNFGPSQEDAKSVEWIVDSLVTLWGEGAGWTLDEDPSPHEASYLKLDCSKALERLKWGPILSMEEALKWIVEWQKCYDNGSDMRKICFDQIDTFMKKIRILN